MNQSGIDQRNTFLKKNIMFGILNLPSGPKHLRSYLLWDTLVWCIGTTRDIGLPLGHHTDFYPNTTVEVHHNANSAQPPNLGTHSHKNTQSQCENGKAGRIGKMNDNKVGECSK